MRVFALALVLAAVGAAAAVGTAAGTATKPALRIVDAEPLVARGSGFDARERVTVYATTRERTLVRRVRAGRGGGFTVRFPTAFDFCAGVTRLRAVGARSGIASIRPTPRPCVFLD